MGREHPQKFVIGIPSLQFHLSFEEELISLGACLQRKDITDEFVSQQNSLDYLFLFQKAILTWLMDDNPKTSMR